MGPRGMPRRDVTTWRRAANRVGCDAFAGKGVSGAEDTYEVFVDQRLVVHVVGESAVGADGERDVSSPDGFDVVGRLVLESEVDSRGLLGDGFDPRPGDDCEDHFVGSDRVGACVLAGIELGRALQCSRDRLERAVEFGEELGASGCDGEASAGSDQQRIAERVAAAVECAAGGRYGQVESLGCSGDAALHQERVRDGQQVQIDGLH